jgi:hypothetical protein
MKTKHKTPAGYVAPLRSRAAIVAWLLARAESNSRPSYGLFCYNVKLYRLNTDFSHAVKLAKESGVLACESDRYLAECQALWDNGSSETAFEVGTQDACESVTDDDSNRMLWDGSGAIAEWEFNGRSGGWLCLKEFDGVNLSAMDRHEFEAFTEPGMGASFPWLRNLYRFLVQCDHDFRRPESEVEYQAAGWFFANAVHGIKTDAELQAEQYAAMAESAERSHWEARDTVTTL